MCYCAPGEAQGMLSLDAGRAAVRRATPRGKSNATPDEARPIRRRRSRWSGCRPASSKSTARYGDNSPAPADRVHAAGRRQRTGEAVRSLREAVAALGVHLGLRRDCGSTLAQVGAPQTVSSDEAAALRLRRGHPQLPQPGRREGQRQLPGRRSRDRRPQRVHRRPRHAAAADPVGRVRRAVLRRPGRPPTHRNIFIDSTARTTCRPTPAKIIRAFATRAFRRPITAARRSALMAVFEKSFAGGGKLSGEREGRAAGGADVAAVPVPDREQQHAGSRSRSTTTNWRPSCRTSCGTARRIAATAAAGRERHAARSSWMPKSSG